MSGLLGQPTAQAGNQDLWTMFKDALQDHQKNKGTERYYEELYGSVAPAGNIYRRNAFYLLERIHSSDLWDQMREIAEKHRHLLGGYSRSIDECAQVLHNELENTVVDLPDAEAPIKLLGYVPILDLLKCKVVRWGPLYVYKDAEKRSQEIKNRLVSLNVFLLQAIAPLLIFLNRWQQPENRFKLIFQPGYAAHKLTLKELLCFGLSLEDVCTTLLGMLLLFGVVFIIYCYAEQEVVNIRKMRRLPHHDMWLWIDVFTNVWCVALILLDMPLLYWSEESVTNIVLDSMTFIFLFKLDDLSEVLCSYLGMGNVEFQRMVVGITTCLAMCPVHLDKVINSDAKNSKDLWRIKVDNNGTLLGSDGSPCLSRLHYAANEDRPIQSYRPAGAGFPIPSDLGYGSLESPTWISGTSFEKAKLIYYSSRGCHEILPSWSTAILEGFWKCMSRIIFFGIFLIPFVWYLFCKPCYS